MEISTLFGLPAHPLLVHAVVVLAPLAAVGALVIAASGSIRRRIGWLVVAAAVATVVLVPLTTSSGEELEEQVSESAAVEQHAGLGETLLPWSIVLLVGSAGVVAADLPALRDRGWQRNAAIAVAAVAVVGALGTTIQTVRIGHSGAEATWSSVASAQAEGD